MDYIETFSRLSPIRVMTTYEADSTENIFTSAKAVRLLSTLVAQQELGVHQLIQTAYLYRNITENVERVMPDGIQHSIGDQLLILQSYHRHPSFKMYAGHQQYSMT